jgi:hypothetical protein
MQPSVGSGGIPSKILETSMINSQDTSVKRRVPHGMHKLRQIQKHEEYVGKNNKQVFYSIHVSSNNDVYDMIARLGTQLAAFHRSYICLSKGQQAAFHETHAWRTIRFLHSGGGSL